MKKEMTFNIANDSGEEQFVFNPFSYYMPGGKSMFHCLILLVEEARLVTAIQPQNVDRLKCSFIILR